MKRSYALSTWVFLRGLGLVYLVAWLSFWVQMEGLIGEQGVAPAADLLAALGERAETGWWDYPSLAWLGASNGALHALCAAGTGCAVLLLVGWVPGPALLGSWLTYLSIVTIGRPFMAFQWDALLLETGFTALLVAPWVWRSSARGAREPLPFGRWLLYLLLFKVMFSSGLVKLQSGDPAWEDLTALTHHYETQPLPHVLGYWAHHLPPELHTVGAAAMFAVELGAPFLILFPGRPRRLAGAAFVGLMVLIAGTGNYGFFNLLTVVLCVPLFDDAVGWRWLPSSMRARLAAPQAPVQAAPKRWQRGFAGALAVLVLVFGGGQLLMTVFSPDLPRGAQETLARASAFRTFNRYGLFAIMTKRRPEIVIEGSRDGRRWKAYHFEFKPGDLEQRPRFAGPHMPRLDWQMWFAALGNVRRNPWLVHMMQRLLEGEPAVLGLLDEERNPFPDRPPRFLRAVKYDYRFTRPQALDETGRWWRREREGPYTPTLRRPP